jgi:cbb3-type cytochrome c oxidase subunit III
MRISKRTLSVLVVMAAALVMGAVTFQAAEKADGAEIFRSKCSMCHGVDGKGYAALKTPDFTDPKWQDSVTDKDILDAIKNGKKGTAMPAFAGKLSEQEILAVLKQVRAFKGKK